MCRCTVFHTPHTGGRDYGLFPEPSVQLSAIILSNETQLLFGVQIRDDRVVENNETFTAELQLVQVNSNPSNVEIGLNLATVVINDNDCEDSYHIAMCIITKCVIIGWILIA